MDRRTLIHWNEFLDWISPAPLAVQRALRCKVLVEPLSYRNRVYLVAFCVQNGIVPDILYRVLHLNRSLTDRKYRKIEELFVYLSVDPTSEDFRRRLDRYHSFDLIIGRVVTLSKRPINNRGVRNPAIPGPYRGRGNRGSEDC